MTPIPETNAPNALSQAELRAEFQTVLHEKMRAAIRLTLAMTLEDELESFIGAARYQRGTGRRDQRNGYYPRDLVTSVGKINDLPVPRSRGGFRTQVFERYHCRQAELDTAMGEMFVFGTSTPRVGEVVETLTGHHPSPSTVSRVFHTLDAEFEAWKTRPLAAHYVYAFADGTYFTVIYDGHGQKMPILAVIGIRTDGGRKNQPAWADLLAQLKQRGVQTIDLWITDGNQAMLNAVQAQFPNAARQRCVKHKLENVLSYVPKKQRDHVVPELTTIFYQADRTQAAQAATAFAEKFRATYPTAVACLERDLEAYLTFYVFPETHWKTIRTTNVIERLFGEVKRRSHKMAAAFRNEGSCLVMFFAVIRTLHFRKITMLAQ